MFVYMSENTKENEFLFWNNGDGWVGLDTATEFTIGETKTLNAPINPPYNVSIVKKEYAQNLVGILTCPDCPEFEHRGEDGYCWEHKMDLIWGENDPFEIPNFCGVGKVQKNG